MARFAGALDVRLGPFDIMKQKGFLLLSLLLLGDERFMEKRLFRYFIPLKF